MKIINRSELAVEDGLWYQIADTLAVETLRRKRWEGHQAELRVVVDAAKPRHGPHNALFGRHSPKKIMIFPCRDCTPGTVLITFLHEILHEWIFWTRPKLYDEDWTEDLCESAARRVFERLGGAASPEQSCRRYHVDLPVGPLSTHPRAQGLLDRLDHLSPDELRVLAASSVL